MRWRTGRRSSNVEDRRGIPAAGKAAGGGIVVIVIALVLMFLGVDPSFLLQQQTSSVDPTGTTAQPRPAGEEQLVEFVKVVLADTEDTWNALYRKAGSTYREPKLVLFTGAVQSACGFAKAAMGPFYCPADQKVYIDLSFYRDLRERHNAPGDFAQAYVIAHEIGHHVQNMQGTLNKVHNAKQQLSAVEANKMQVRVELQADCFAGLWAHHAHKARHVIEEGDVTEALNAASAIGDDRLQKQARGYVTPDSFTHGSSAQRVEWFKRGLQQGTLQACDTFNTQQL